jgi:type IV pilus assembly protein PilW
MNQFITTRQCLNLAKQSGIGLIELLVSMLIGLFIMGGVLQLFSTSSQNAVAVSGSSRIQENVRFVFSRIADDISQSGNLGCISSSVAGASYSANVPIVSEVGTLTGDPFDFLTPVRISNAPDAGTAPAPANARAPGTDELSIGYVDNAIRLDVVDIAASSVTVSAADAALLAVGDIVAVSNCFQGAIFSVTVNPGSGVISHAAGFDKNISSFILNTAASAANVVSPFYLYGGKTGAYEYSVGTSAAAATACISAPAPPALGQENCALFRADASGTRQELAQGVHDIQVQYGWTDNAGNLRFADAPNAAQTALVDRMRVTMAFNSIDNVNTVGNNIDQTAGGLIVKTYSRTFNLFNRL